jgi:hypothetical protein
MYLLQLVVASFSERALGLLRLSVSPASRLLVIVYLDWTVAAAAAVRRIAEPGTRLTVSGA